MWEAVFFDFDGVILDSVHVKTRAFAKLFRSYGPDIEKQVVDYHLANGGVSRFEKFRYYYEYLLHKPITDQILEDLGNRFSGLVVQEVLEAPFIKGALETLKKLNHKQVPLFVVSGTPQEEMEHIVKMRGLSKYFKEVHGSPRTKDAIIKELEKKYQFNLDQCLFVGDAMTDYDAAQQTGTMFLGIVSRQATSPFPSGTPTAPAVTFRF